MSNIEQIQLRVGSLLSTDNRTKNCYSSLLDFWGSYLCCDDKYEIFIYANLAIDKNNQTSHKVTQN